MKENKNNNLDKEKKELEKRLSEIKKEKRKQEKNKIKGQLIHNVNKIKNISQSNTEINNPETISNNRNPQNYQSTNMGVLMIIVIIIGIASGLLGAYIVLKTRPIVTTSNGITTSNISLNETNSITESVTKVYDAVVVVEGYSNNQLSSTGTGFVYKKENNKAYIMTNHHVVSECDSVKVLFTNGEELKTTLVGSDAYADIAVLSVKDSDKIKSAIMGASEKSKVGDTLFTVGSPEGADYAGSVTKGILSGKDRLVAVALSNNNSSDYYMNVIQTDAAINPGNSGGPICNINGEVIGITNMKLVDDSVEGMGFAIPIEDALEFSNTLEKKGKISRPYIGISMLDLTNSYELWQSGIDLPKNVKSGIIIYSVESNSPADKANLKKGDVITKLGNEETKNLAEFRYQLYKLSPNDKVKITFIRDGKEQTTEITLGESK